jgi:hypothetical protein
MIHILLKEGSGIKPGTVHSIEQASVDCTGLGLQLVEVLQASFADQVVR